MPRKLFFCESCRHGTVDWAKHAGTVTHRLGVLMNAARERGWIQAGSAANMILKSAAPHAELPSYILLYPDGNKGDDRDFGTTTWTPIWAARVASLVTSSPDERRHWIERLSLDDEVYAHFEDVAASLLALGGKPALVDFLRERMPFPGMLSRAGKP